MPFALILYLLTAQNRRRAQITWRMADPPHDHRNQKHRKPDNQPEAPNAAGDRILVNKLGETVRSTIQEMIDEQLSQRKSILFG